MSDATYKKEIVTHLEFLGYELQDLDAEQGHTYIAKNPNRSTLLVRIYNNTSILTTRYGGFQIKALKSRDFFETINAINQDVMGKWYYQADEEDQEVTIVTEMDYYDYNKTTFGTLIDSLENEVRLNIMKFEKFAK